MKRIDLKEVRLYKAEAYYRVRAGIFAVLLLLSFGLLAQDDPEAGKWLDEASSTMSGYETISMDFDYVLDNQSEDVSQELTGSLLLKGEKYVVNLFGSTQIFDGSKTYTIIPENEEVNISDADLDPENTFTPSKFYSFYKSGYSYDMDEQKSMGGKKIQFVRLTPIDSDSEVASILVGIEVGTKHIYQVIEIGKNDTRTTLTARNMQTDGNIGDDAFTFDEKKYADMNYLINR
jgi:outer membrane lipoprotein-sorting protein